jgi:hypothetical protein
MHLNIVCPARNRCSGEFDHPHVADTGQKVGLAAFAVVNLNGSSWSAQPKFGVWLSHE